MLLGIQLIINGLNWWVKLIDAYPSITDLGNPGPDPHMLGFMREMINTHLIFHLVKAVEFISGVLLAANVGVPFALVFGYPVAVIAFLVDVFLTGHLRARVMGGGVLFNMSFMMCAYLGHYRSMLVWRAEPDSGGAWELIAVDRLPTLRVGSIAGESRNVFRLTQTFSRRRGCRQYGATCKSHDAFTGAARGEPGHKYKGVHRPSPNAGTSRPEFVRFISGTFGSSHLRRHLRTRLPPRRYQWLSQGHS